MFVCEQVFAYRRLQYADGPIMYFVYSFLYVLALIISSPYWLLGMLRDGKYRAGFSERFGSVPRRLKLPHAGQDSIWVHAVSVGEVLAVSGLISALATEHPETRIFVSTTTLAGQRLAWERFGAKSVFYMPLDLTFAIRLFLKAIRPRTLILAETEFWPNVLRMAKARGTRIVVVNARISDRSFPGYRRFRFLLGRVLGNVDLFLSQTDVDRERLIAIGAIPERVLVSGNLKFDIKTPAESALSRVLRHVLSADQRVLVFGSTVEGEEPLLVPCFKAVLREFDSAVIVLAPRHPERFDAVAELLRNSGMSFWRRSAWNSSPIAQGVLLLDTIGELASVYSLADLAFVGGSLVPRGGHNILEPAQFAKPIVIGPYYENFREIVRVFLSQDAVLVSPPEKLTDCVMQLLRSPDEAAQLGSRAKSVVESGRGSTQRTLEALGGLLEDSPMPDAQISAPRR